MTSTELAPSHQQRLKSEVPSSRRSSHIIKIIHALPQSLYIPCSGFTFFIALPTFEIIMLLTFYLQSVPSSCEVSSLKARMLLISLTNVFPVSLGRHQQNMYEINDKIMKKMGGKEEARKRKQTKWNSHYLTELLLPREVTALAWQILQFLKEARNPVIYHISLFLKYFFILQQLLNQDVSPVIGILESMKLRMWKFLF